MQTASEIVSPADFDFIIGSWHVLHKRLNVRLQNCQDWTEFQGTSTTRKILGGFGNVEDNILYFNDGEVSAAAFRSYDLKTKCWAIWWLDSRFPHNIDVPVVGSFTGSVGTFLARDTLDGKPIDLRFTWNKNLESNPIWEQAFSSDGGITWETNWKMKFKRSEA